MHKNKPEIILYVKKYGRILSKKFKETKVHVPLRETKLFLFQAYIIDLSEKT